LNNVRVFLEFSTRDNKLGRVECELYEDVAPKTVKNFLAFIDGKDKNNKKTNIGYKGCNVHRIIPDFMIQAGDFTRGDGTGGYSIYGKYFEDETFDMKHDQPGLLSMANCGPDTNGSQFFITLDYLPHLDNKHVVFGKVTKGMDVVKKVESYGTMEGKPTDIIKIINCGRI